MLDGSSPVRQRVTPTSDGESGEDRQTGVSMAVIVAALVLGGWFGKASTQQPTPEQIAAIRQSCRSDFMSHCAGVQPGGRDALQCLKRNAGGVSAPCKTALDAVGPKPVTGGAEPAPAPAQAGPTPPGETPPGAGPAEGARPAPRQVGAVPPACRSEFGAHCPGVRPGGPRGAPVPGSQCRRPVSGMSRRTGRRWRWRRRRPAGRRPHHRMPAGKRAALVATCYGAIARTIR
jgi:hypothetical protein